MLNSVEHKKSVITTGPVYRFRANSIHYTRLLENGYSGKSDSHCNDDGTAGQRGTFSYYETQLLTKH